MDGADLLNDLNSGSSIEPEDKVFDSIWNEYERVILHSLVTSFGLDFLVQDQYGGDVDTIENVRKIGKDAEMKYKNPDNLAKYDARGAYDNAKYHSHPLFRGIKKDARREFDTKGVKQKDAYVPGNEVIPRNNNTILREHQGQLDHVMSAHEIHDDRGRVLAEMNGVELANSPGNLRFTNAALNLNKSDMTVDEYINWCEANPEKVNWNGKKGEPLPDDVKNKLRAEYNCAKKDYDAKLAKKYYTSPKFLKDTASAVGKKGTQMGLRQALGFVFVEVFISAKNKLLSLPDNSSLSDMIKAVGEGIKEGFAIAKEKYKEILAKFMEGFAAGALGSLTTTLCNIFFTTSKNLVKCIRQVYASIIQACRVLLFNPDNLFLGDRLKAAVVILATGASVLVGSAVGELIGGSPIGKIPTIGSIVTVFCSTLVSGLLSCTFLVALDRCDFMKRAIILLNQIATEANNYKEIADKLTEYAARLAEIDTEKFKSDVDSYKDISELIEESKDEDDLNGILLDYYEKYDIHIPWEGDFDDFMSNPSNHLVFS